MVNKTQIFSNNSNYFVLHIERFGDGYIMIGFSMGYFLVISTYHKEIGEVNKEFFVC
jgi:hypothetical protein